MKKKSLLALLLVLVMLISACGGKGDFEVGYDESTSAVIQLNGASAKCDSDAVDIAGSTVTIKDEGTYILRGTLDDGMIIVSAAKEDKTQIVLDNVTINSETSAPIYVLQADKVFITMAADSKNTLSNGGTFTAIDENNIDAAIFSKDDLTLNGFGRLTINSPAGHGIVSKDELRITSGTYDISAGGDGISASADMKIQDGTFNIVTGGGSVNAAAKTSDSSEDSTSMKGIKAATSVTINGGAYTIQSADDAVHSNGNVTVNGGTFEIATGDDGFHADDTLTVTNGTINISACYEGLEGLHVCVSGGNVTLVASDDGFNAAGGTDSSGTGGMRGGDHFGGGGPRGGRGEGGMGGSSNGSIEISGGTISIHASGDGLDANGTLEISGGTTVVSGPVSGDTATLDYDISGVITGGTFIGTGAAGMAQTFSDSRQGVVAVSAGNQNAGTKITLKDAGGNVILEHEALLSFSVVILSSPDIEKGETYTITVGTASGEFPAS